MIVQLIPLGHRPLRSFIHLALLTFCALQLLKTEPQARRQACGKCWIKCAQGWEKLCISTHDIFLFFLRRYNCVTYGNKMSSSKTDDPLLMMCFDCDTSLNFTWLPRFVMIAV